MLQTVRIRNDRGDILELRIFESVLGLYVKNIDGLDPVKATIVTSGLAGQDGVQYKSSRRDSRNIIFKLGIETGDHSVAFSLSDLD